MLRAGQSSTEPQDRLQHGSGDICQSCLSEGRKSRVRKFQINPEECVFSCSSEKCLSNFSSSSLILKRKASEIPNLRKRRRKSCPVQERPPDLPRSNVTLLWQNKQALCWLDSSLLLMVFCTSLRKCLFASKDELSLKQLCKYFDDAQLKLEAIFNRTRTTCSKSNNTDESLCYSDPPHDNYQFDTKTSKETYSNFGDPLELLQALGEIPSISLLQNDEENSLIELDRISSEDPELSEAVSVLDESRERIWEQLQPELRCKKDDEESPVFALPLLLRKNKQFEAHFRSSYHWQFYCSRCHFVEICHEKRVVLSLKTLNRSLSPTSYFSLRVCPYCQSPQGRNRLVIHKLPACPMFHFVDGLPPLKSWEQLEFHHGSYDYKVAAIIQYQQNPNHFVAWIRDNHRNLWLEGDDLKQPVVRWREEEPKFPASQAHLVMWERQGGCSECLEEQELVKNILVADNSELKQVLQRPQGNLMDSGEKVQVVNYLKAYIPKRTQDLSPIGAHASKATETSTNVLNQVAEPRGKSQKCHRCAVQK
ncbi:putative SUMO-specific isopeptidase USPL1 [Apostichopus japonicus]|uniref:Putative SUMO-specific isopeptidase USPL1 n=1 Tax=Stichopus japonicus TaxID=307972 RepID=A0A2G8JFP3_STIJA|nr:putative SUMO-specific isopeptidase USPL1 [Apostichopus japonicus]